ncbi:hypothetical protein ACGTN6_14485 [Halomonas sp. THAF12]|uniref:hypothetical protein n=1 Tax=Halomonas sp. B23F22_10 TaxID=3459515 RepID=UPI00373E9A56
MAYFLVMGGLALAVCFTLGWGLWQSGRWVSGRLPRRRPASARRGDRAKPRRGSATPRREAAGRRAAASPSPPWALTRGLARLRGAWPLALLACALYGGAQLVANGMAARPRPAPGAFLRLVDVLGWGAAGLLGMALLGLLAAWRCRR